MRNKIILGRMDKIHQYHQKYKIQPIKVYPGWLNYRELQLYSLGLLISNNDLFLNENFQIKHKFFQKNETYDCYTSLYNPSVLRHENPKSKQ